MHPRPNRQPVSTPTLAACLVLAVVTTLAGCNIAGPAYYFIHGPEKIPRLYELNKERPTVIFIDDRAMRIQRTPTRERIAAAAERSLLDNGALVRVLDSRAAAAVVTNEPRGELMAISEIGREVGAEVVIYVTPDAFALSTDGQTFQPVARLRVKVLDAVSDERLWPEAREGHLLTVTASRKQGSTPSGAAEVREAEDKFADLVGLRLAQMFYSSEAETVSDERER